MRKMCRMPPRTHCQLLEHLYGSYDIEYELSGRCISFYHCIRTSKIHRTRLCYMLRKTSMTPVSMNRRQLGAKVNIDGESLNEFSKSKSIKLYDCNDVKQVELSLVKDGILNIDIDLGDDDTLCCINRLCLD